MKNILILFSIFLVSSFFIGNAFAFETDQKSYISSKYNPTEIKITGVIDNYQIGNRFYVELIAPDSFSKEYDVRITNKGDFSLIIKAEPDWLVGSYAVIANYDGIEVSKTSFEIKLPEDFRTSMITKPVTEPKKETIQTISTQKPSTIPEWVKNIALWYGQGTVSEEDFINAIQYLTDKGIIKLKGNTNSTNESTPQPKTTSPVQSTTQPKPVPPEPKPVPPEPKPTSQTEYGLGELSYDELMRYNEKYVGKTVNFKGQVLQVLNLNHEEYSAVVQTKCKTWYDGDYLCNDDPVWINYSDTRILEDDIISFKGDVKGLKIYKSVLGASVTTPEINVIAITIEIKKGDK